MLFLLAGIAIPANMLGIFAFVYGIRGKDRSPMLVVGILALLAAMATTSVTVIGGIELDHFGPDSSMGDREMQADHRRDIDEQVRWFALAGAVASLMPWLGSLVALVRARGIDD